MILEVKNLQFAYDADRTIFEDVCLSVDPGQIFTILGRNGAGKSTLLNCLANLYTPKAGEILLDGQPMKNMKLVTDLLANEKFHYVELSNPAGIQEKLWDIGNDIQQRHLMRISYTKQGDKPTPVTRIVEPVSILFSEYYFYLNAYIVVLQTDGRYEHKYDYPAIFRIDRIEDYELMDERFSLPYANRFQEGEFRKRVQFMYPGRLEKIRFRYTGKSVDAILDRLPTAKIISQGDHIFEIEAEVYGKGIVMWLLSQGEHVEVIAPAHLREKMRDTLLNMLELYR